MARSGRSKVKNLSGDCGSQLSQALIEEYLV
jgi:hypothetical protein